MAALAHRQPAPRPGRAVFDRPQRDLFARDLPAEAPASRACEMPMAKTEAT